MRVDQAVVVITGASSGMGRAAALALAKRGAVLVLGSRREEALKEVAASCRARGAVASPFVTDVAEGESVEELARHALDRHGRIDVWINNAAVSGFAPFTRMPLEDFRRILEVNLMGYVHGARAVLPHFRERGRGTLINVSSVVAAVPQRYTHAYGMSKAAIRALSTGLRQELASAGLSRVRVCGVLPSAIDTPLFGNAANYTGCSVRAMPPVYSPERVARAVVRLVRRPKAEVVVGGAGRGLLVLSRLSPRGAAEAMRRHVERGHLGRRAAPPDAGALHRPVQGTGAVHGGWYGRGRTATRRVAAAALAAAAGYLALRTRSRHSRGGRRRA